jgi:serine/threonine protein kinase
LKAWPRSVTPVGSTLRRLEVSLERGLTLNNRYRLVEKLGSGGMGEVWLGTDVTLRRRLAIKFLRSQDDAADELMARFKREARTVAGLTHPGITVVFDIGWHHGELFFVMEFLDGQDLGKLLRAKPNGLPLEQGLSVAAQVAEALAAAHANGIIHRDIKPANLMMLAGGHMKICDFGIAKLTDGATRITGTGQLIGTPAYMAPEYVRGEDIDHRADLYSLGCVLHEVLTGRPPFPSDRGIPALINSHLNTAAGSLRVTRPEVPHSVDRLVLGLLSKDPGDRPVAAGVVAEELRTAREEIRARDHTGNPPDGHGVEMGSVVEEARSEASEIMAAAKADAAALRATAEREVARLHHQVEELTRRRDSIRSDLGQLRDLLAGLRPPRT